VAEAAPASAGIAAGAPAPAPAPAAAEQAMPLASAEAVESKPMAKSVAAPQRAAARTLAAASAADVAGAGASKAEAPACRMETARSFDRDAAGRVVARHRVGAYPGAGGADLPLAIDERFVPGGRLRSAVVTIGGRRITVSESDAAAGRLEPVPGVRLAADAGEAERDAPRCEP
jgi:hypothetical protein